MTSVGEKVNGIKVFYNRLMYEELAIFFSNFYFNYITVYSVYESERIT